jgi:transcriptional regulator with XRE-family HTH domain
MRHEMPRQRLGTIVKDLRIKHGMSQRELANLVGVSDPYITLLETNQRKNPSLAVLKRLAKALKVSVAELVE